MSTGGVVYKDLIAGQNETEPAVAEERNTSNTLANKPGLKDLLPVPHQTDPEALSTSTTLVDRPSDSHALALDAAKAPEQVGAAQLSHDEDEVKDLGWNEPTKAIANPLVGGLSNEDVWLLVRRFNAQMYQVKEIHTPPIGGLDLNISDDEEFSPDKMRSYIERLYMTTGMGVMSFYKHIVRLRSWRETRRTTWFCTVYFLAWAFDLVVPLIAVTLIALIAYPPCRQILFPSAPISLVSTETGGVQKPKAGVLGSGGATGAPENHKGEAVEQEASNFVNGVASVAVASATGHHPQAEPSTQDALPDASISNIAGSIANAKDQAAGGNLTKDHDKTKVPIETAMWTKMRPIMHGLGNGIDTWERFANALSPTAPFPQDRHRLRLAAVIVPLFFTSLFVTSYMFMKGITFGIGFGFFGDPVISRGLDLLNRKFPNWQKLLELRNTLFKGVPTNAQLTITLLRIGEANKAPLPPAPHLKPPPPGRMPFADDDKEHLKDTLSNYELQATDSEIDDAMAATPVVSEDSGGAKDEETKGGKHKKGSRLVAFFKGGVKGGVTTAIGTDKVKAKVFNTHYAKERLGAVPPKDADLTSGPVDFKARFDGKKGHVYISTKATVPCVAFSTDSSIEKMDSEERQDLHPVWSIPVGQIRELKKVGGYGWKAKLVVGWAMDREVADGLEIVTRDGEKTKVTALPLRDELFNRLIAIGGQKWECW